MKAYRYFLLPVLALLALTAPIRTDAQAVHHHHSRHHHTRIRRAAVSQGVTVWVNTKTGIYHMPGERWYGRTQEGEYMSQKAADAAGYRETENGQ